jgi:LuxR family maltose regulon positive regulatory protein
MPLDVMVVVDDEEYRRLPRSIALFRAAQAQARGDVLSAMTHARRARDLVAEGDLLGRGTAAGLLGLASWASGDLEAAHRMYAECMASVQRAGYISDALGCAIAMADIQIAQGRPREAMNTYERALQVASARGGLALRGTADIHVGLSQLHLERDDLPAATQHLLMSQELGEYAGLGHPRQRKQRSDREHDPERGLELAGILGCRTGGGGAGTDGHPRSSWS